MTDNKQSRRVERGRVSPTSNDPPWAAQTDAHLKEIAPFIPGGLLPPSPKPENQNAAVEAKLDLLNENVIRVYALLEDLVGLLCREPDKEERDD